MTNTMPKEMEPRFHQAAKLPSGQSCRNCVNFAACADLAKVSPHNTVCDYSPNRFQFDCGN